jgi:hypothetical protein
VIIQSTADPISGQATGSPTLVDGKATVGFIGIPGYTYSIQRSTNLSTWHTIHSQAAPANGRFSFTDDFTVHGNGTPPPTAYYRLSWTP